MQEQPTEIYAERLLTTASARLLFNTTDELERFLDIRGIRTNGIVRCCHSPQRIRATYRDLDIECSIQTSGQFSLTWLLPAYQAASDFYKSRLARRRDPEATATALLRLYYGTPLQSRPAPSLLAIAREMKELNINPGILLLLMLGAIPTYGARTGDVADIDAQFARVLCFLSRFTLDPVFDELPVVKIARAETRRNRVTLIRHALLILGVHEAFSSPQNVASTATALKQQALPLDLAGFWSSPQLPDSFIRIEAAADSGTYFATLYRPEGPSLLSSAIFTVTFSTLTDSHAVLYVQGPEAMKHLILKRKLDDADRTWYLTPAPDSDAPAELTLACRYPSPHWPERLRITRITDPIEADKLLLKISQPSRVIDHYEDSRYTLITAIAAITPAAVYVHDPDGQCYYRIPRHTPDAFESITMGDNVGIIHMGDERYLAIDDRMIYIPVTPPGRGARQLRRHGITRVTDLPAAILKDTNASDASLP